MWENRVGSDSAAELTTVLPGGDLTGDPGGVSLAPEPLDDSTDDCIVLGYN